MADSQANGQGIALVTGASRGIGRAVARRLATEGFAVAVNYRQSNGAAHALVEEIEKSGGRAGAFPADMALPSEAVELLSRVEEELGPVSVLVNNAGITRDRLLLQMSEDDWAATWQTDLAGPRTLANRALEGMSERRFGRIINVSSVVGITGNAGQSNYAAAKSALMGFTRDLALRAAKHNVTVNCVVPGYIATDATSHLTAEQRQIWLDRIPMSRYATPDEVADIIVFLAGKGATYITGQCLAVDGGLLAATGSGFDS
jgi:3-oxoacyl-[acyl-carrier protein] reductase